MMMRAVPFLISTDCLCERALFVVTHQHVCFKQLKVFLQVGARPLLALIDFNCTVGSLSTDHPSTVIHCVHVSKGQSTRASI